MNQLFRETSVSHHRHTAHRLVERFSAAKGSAFQFSLRRFRASDPGDTLITARSFGAFSGKRRIKESVGKRDRDIYQFTFGDLTDLRLKIKNQSKANLFGEILDSQGQVVRFKGDKLSVKIKAGKAIENSYEGLPSGVYYLRVRSRGAGKNTYQLKLSAANTFPSLPDCGCTS